MGLDLSERRRWVHPPLPVGATLDETCISLLENAACDRLSSTHGLILRTDGK